MTDTYSTTPETTLAPALLNQANQDLLTLAEQSRVAPWMEIDELVSKDDIRLFTLITDHGGYVLPPDNRTQPNLFGDAPELTNISQSLADELGFLSTGNLRAMLNRVIDKGWVVQSECALTGGLRMDMSVMGRYFWEMWERERGYDVD